ncbi:MAG: HU family DNA-binding protein [Lentimicrobiaceae bacterium]|jgi:predicted histone-like DNA-binding protein|nr:HU family DNA-binding protein [Lentimicrobiaceae bacterium]
MAVNYKPVPKKNPAKQDEHPKYYAQAVSTGDLSLRQLAKMITEVASVKSADTMAVLEALLDVLPMALADGKIVRLGDFGSFNLSIKSDGTEDINKLTSANIRKVAVNFRPGKEFTNALEHLVFNKIV